jgi:hypothetical protein
MVTISPGVDSAVDGKIGTLIASICGLGFVREGCVRRWIPVSIPTRVIVDTASQISLANPRPRSEDLLQ